MLSVIIITKNETKHIRRCLESVKWVDEIIVLDSGSTDDTVAICREYTDHVFETDWPGFGPQKQRALDKATGDWVLSIDADEVVTEPLKEAIVQAMQNTRYHGYELTRHLVFYGQEIRFANARDRVCRLVKRDAAKFSADKVHESLHVIGSVGRLAGVLLHYSYDSVTDLIQRMNDYTDLTARNRIQGKKTGGVWRGLWMFFRIYVLDGGFLDGRAGWVLATGFAQGTYYKYVKTYYGRL